MRDCAQSVRDSFDVACMSIVQRKAIVASGDGQVPLDPSLDCSKHSLFQFLHDFLTANLVAVTP